MDTGAHDEVSLEAVVARLTARLDEVEHHEQEHRNKVAALEQANAALREEVATLRNAQLAASKQTDGRTKGPRTLRTSRRRLLATAGAAAAAAVVLAAEGGTGTAHAASARADTATLLETASGSGNIAIEGDGTSGAIGVGGTSDSNIGVAGNSTSGAAVFGASGSGPGVIGSSTSGQGGLFSGGQAPISLVPAGNPRPPSFGFHDVGDIWLDSNTTLWICTGAGTPGTWAWLPSVANGTSGGSVHYLAAPMRLLDARSGATSGLINRGPLTAGEIYALSVAGLGGSGIPSGALGLICNVTVLGPSANGNLSLFPAGAAIPTTASMTFVAGAFLANHVSAALGFGKVNIQNQSGGNAPLVVDAVGFIM